MSDTAPAVNRPWPPKTIPGTIAELKTNHVKEPAALSIHLGEVDFSQSTAINFIKCPDHGNAARVLFEALEGTTIAERIRLDGRDDFYYKKPGSCSYEPFLTIRDAASSILEKAADIALEALIEKTEGKEIKDLYSAIGKAKAKARTRDFVSGALAFLGDKVLVPGGKIPWNATPECIPTLTDVLDFSGDELTIRETRGNEYFRNPAPCTARDVFDSAGSDRFLRYMETLFHDPETTRSGLSCVAACVSGRPTKTFQIWSNAEGDGGKSSLYDLIAGLVPGRVVMAKSALVLYRGDSGERRFGEIEMMGRAGVFFDEVGGAFDVAQVKRYAGLSAIRGESKGRDSLEFPQTWALVALCNELPRFAPADDGGFLSRLFVLPFEAIFFTDEADRQRRLKQGIAPERLKPAVDKADLLANLLTDRAGIIRTLADTWIAMRQERNGKPFDSPMCARAREAYRKSNDMAEQFYDEYLKRQDGASLSYPQIKEAWAEYFGIKSPDMRAVIAQLTKRFLFISAGKSNGQRVLKNIALAGGDSSSNIQTPSDDGELEMDFPEKQGTGGTQKANSLFEETKSEKVYTESKMALCVPPVPATSANQTSDPSCWDCAKRPCEQGHTPDFTPCDDYTPKKERYP